ncbi:hypothetical protein [Actinosynnema sp. NPDC020468]|uniref:hypothetical protein n=1 Tax=Actinosynnema sp. NPDC020468 TaxID=3154488 RepID=UPI003406A2AB
MNEHELRSALRDALVASSPPPPMDPHAAIARGRRVQRRRRAAWTGVAAGVAVMAVAAGTAVVPGLNRGVDAAAALTTSPSSPASSASSTETPWPNGQTDRTSANGPRAETGLKLLELLSTSLPAGLKAVDRTSEGRGNAGQSMRYHQAQFVDYLPGGGQTWEYLARTPVTDAGGDVVARVEVQVETKGSTRLPSIACEVVTAVPYPAREGAGCAEVKVGDKPVTVVTGGTGYGFEQVAFHRYDDGTLVMVEQDREYADSGLPGMTDRPLTQDQLVALAVDPQFHLD